MKICQNGEIKAKFNILKLEVSRLENIPRPLLSCPHSPSLPLFLFSDFQNFRAFFLPPVYISRLLLLPNREEISKYR